MTDLAERLHSLYRMYNCEDELPNDLVEKLDEAGEEVCQSFRHELSKGQVYPLSLEEAMDYVGLSSRALNFYALISVTWPDLGLKSVPMAFKVSFLVSKREIAEGLIDGYNYEAKAIFGEFKKEIRYELDEEFREKVDSGLYYNPGQE